MTMRKSAATIALLAAFLSGCVAMMPAPPNLSDDKALIAPGVVFAIPQPASLGQTVNAAQAIVAHFRGQSYAFDTQIQIAPEQLDLVALDGLGRRALTVSWKPSGMTHEQADWLPPFIRPADILADVVIVHWPQKTVAAALAASGATVADAGNVRKISKGGRDLIVVEYGDGDGWNRSAKVQNLAFGYEIDIQSSEMAR